MDIKNIEGRLKKIIADQLDIKEQDITPDKDFMNDLGVDSLDTIEFVMAIEEEFGIELPDEDIEKIRNIEDAVKYMDLHMTIEKKKNLVILLGAGFSHGFGMPLVKRLDTLIKEDIKEFYSKLRPMRPKVALEEKILVTGGLFNNKINPLADILIDEFNLRMNVKDFTNKSFGKMLQYYLNSDKINYEYLLGKLQDGLFNEIRGKDRSIVVYSQDDPDNAIWADDLIDIVKNSVSKNLADTNIKKNNFQKFTNYLLNEVSKRNHKNIYIFNLNHDNVVEGIIRSSEDLSKISYLQSFDRDPGSRKDQHVLNDFYNDYNELYNNFHKSNKKIIHIPLHGKIDRWLFSHSSKIDFVANTDRGIDCTSSDILLLGLKMLSEATESRCDILSIGYSYGDTDINYHLALNRRTINDITLVDSKEKRDRESVIDKLYGIFFKREFYEYWGGFKDWLDRQ